MTPLAIDLYCGLGGWTEGFLAEGWDVIGFDTVQHVYGEHRYPAQLVLQDVLTLDGRQFKDAACIVASPPCQEFSYMAMPWTRAKQIASALRGQGQFPPSYTGSRTIPELTALFDACFRIQREASGAAGRHIPMVVENVKGAQPWVGRSAWNFGSYHLWGDVPALMPTTQPRAKVGGDWNQFNATGKVSQFNAVSEAEVRREIGPCDYAHTPKTRACGKLSITEVESISGKSRLRLCAKHLPIYEQVRASVVESERATKNDGGSWFNIGPPGQIIVNRNPVHDDVKGQDGGWFNDDKRSGKSTETGRLSQSGSKSSARKAASARIAKIPFALASYIARVYHPSSGACVA